MMRAKQMRIVILTGILMLIINPVVYTQGSTLTLSVGDKAPELTIQHWLKGSPVNTLERDKIYLIEFTAYFCPACRLAIPHLTELAKEFKGEVEVVSIFIGESNPKDSTDTTYLKRIKRLIETEGDKMEFTVGVDDYRQITKEAWGIYGTPTAFVIDRSGKISWSNTPAYLTSNVLNRVIKKKFNADSVMLQEKKYKEFIRSRIMKAGKKDYQSALKSIDSLRYIYPERRLVLDHVKFKVLAGNDDKQANVMLRRMLKSNKNYNWIKLMVDAYLLPRKPDYELALEVAERALYAAPDNHVSVLRTKERIYLYRSRTREKVREEKEDLEKAIKICRQMVAFFQANKNERYRDQENGCKRRMFRYQYRLLRLDSNEKEANAMIKRAFRDKLEYIDWYMLLYEVLKWPYPDYNLALQVADMEIAQAAKASTRSKEVRIPKALKKKADIYALKGNIKKALKTYREAVAYSEKTEEQHKLTFYKQQLEAFKKQHNL